MNEAGDTVKYTLSPYEMYKLREVHIYLEEEKVRKYCPNDYTLFLYDFVCRLMRGEDKWLDPCNSGNQ